MDSATTQINRLFKSVATGQRADAIHQLDRLAIIVSNYLGAEFLGLFCRSHNEDCYVPLALCRNDSIEIDNLSLLVEQWKAPSTVFPSASLVDVHTERADADSDEFAQNNGLSYRAHYFHGDPSDARVVLVAYWNEPPEKIPAEDDAVLQSCSRAVQGMISLTESLGRSGSLSNRIGQLVELFELDPEKLRFRELVPEIINRSETLLPVSHAVLLARRGNREGWEVAMRSARGREDDPIEHELMVWLEQHAGEESLLQGCEWLRSNSVLQGEHDISIATILNESDLKYVLALVYDTSVANDATVAQVVSLYYHAVRVVLGNSRARDNLKRSHRALKRASSKMADMEALAAVTDMTSGVAHDFNNIIGGIIGRVQLMKIRAQEDKLVADLEKIETLAIEGAETVRHIQEFATRTKYKKVEPLDLDEMVRSCIEHPRAMWREEADLHSISVVAESEFDLAMVEGCRGDLLSALDQLIMNAVEHAPEGSTVKVTLTEQSKGFRIAVKDKGQGVPEELASRVFFPFFSTKSQRGSGLGLSIVYGVVVRHGGRTGFEPNADGGATFFMDLDYPDTPEDRETTRRKRRKSGSLKVLVVDDDLQIREVLTDMLTIGGHKPVACEDGFKALQALEKDDFDLIITDLGMPGMSGLDLAGIVHENYPEIPIAMITGWGTQLSPDEVALKGIKSLLAKPFHLKDIRGLVSELVPGATL